MLEAWVRRALDYQKTAIDMVLVDQSPLSELEPVPSFGSLDGSAGLVMYVSPDEQQRRLARRDGTRWPGGVLEAFTNWAEWHRQHAANPHFERYVIEEDSWSNMKWPSESMLAERAKLIGTTLSPEATAIALAEWIAGHRRP